MPEMSAEKIIAACACGAQFRVPASAVGRKVRCSKCNEVFRVEAPPAASEGAEDQDMFAGLSALASMEKKATADPTQAPTGKRMCPQCGGSMSATAALCTSCGYNLATGQVLKGASAKSAKARSLAVGAGTFLIGCVLSALAALVGGVVWFLIAWKTLHEVGWIAWGIGLLAGGGMVLGYRKRNVRAGVVAAGMSVFGIFAAKIMIFAFVAYLMITGNSDNIEFQRAFVAARRTDEALDKREIYEEDKRISAWDGIYEKEYASLQEWPDSKVREEWQRYREEDAQTLAFTTEEGQKHINVADHHTDRRLRADALPRFGDRRQAIYKEEFAKATKLSPDALEAEVKRIDEWEKDGKWQDEDFVRTTLIYNKLDEHIQELYEADEERDYPEGEEWKTLYAEAAEKVEAIPQAERLELIKKVESDLEDKYLRDQLVSHHTARSAKRQGLSDNDPKRHEIEKEQQGRFAAMTHEELLTEKAKKEAWDNGGIWEDSEASRDELIYTYARQAIADEDSRRRESDPNREEYWTPSTAEWKQIYGDAVTKADALPAAERKATVERHKAEQSAAFMQQLEEREGEEFRASAGEAVAGFFSTMFNPLDLLFFGLAVWTAFGVASGRKAEGS